MAGTGIGPRPVVGTALLAAVIGGVLGVQHHGTPDGSRSALFAGRALEPVAGSLLFAVDDDGPESLWTVDAGGGDARELGAHIGPVERPTLSPDASRVAYLAGPSEDDIELVLKPRTGLTPAVTAPGGSNLPGRVAWSVDGSRLAYLANRGTPSSRSIHVVAAAGGTVRDVGPEPAWRRACLPIRPDPGFRRILEPDGCRADPTGEPQQVVWLPDGDLVYVAAFRADDQPGSDPGPYRVISRVLRMDPGEPTAAPTLLAETDGDTDQLDASPDGRHLLFGQENGETRVIRLDGVGRADPVILRTWWGRASAPSWSPDGGRIVFVGLGVATANADGTGASTVSHMPLLHGDEPPPVTPLRAVWSPDGAHIAFSGTTRYGGYALYVMNADGTGQTEVHRSERPVTVLRWTP